MTERPIQAEEISNALRESDINSNFIQIETRREEARIHWFVASPGILVEGFVPQHDQIYRSDTYFSTQSKLSGSSRSLNASTLVTAQSIQLPSDLSKEGIKSFMYDFKRTPETRRVIGLVGLNEPGFPLLRPIKSELHGFMETKLSGKALASAAIEQHLNTADGFGNSDATAELYEQIDETYAGIRANTPTMEEMLTLFKKGSKKNHD